MFPSQLSAVFLVISACSYELRPLQIHRAWGKCRTIWGSSFILSKGPRSGALGFLRSVGYKPYVCCILRTLGNFCGRSSSLGLELFRQSMWVFGGGNRGYGHICLWVCLARSCCFSVFCPPMVGYHLSQVPNCFLIFVSTVCICFTYSTFKDKNNR